MLTPLCDATRASCGGKAATLAVLMRAGLPVPDGFVVPFDSQTSTGVDLTEAVARELDQMGDPVVAVRSSAANEDTATASAAGQYTSILGVRGAADVCDAITACRESVRADRVAGYWNRTGIDAAQAGPDMAVLVQRTVAADVSGVMFTPAKPGGPTRIEASWGLGPSVVEGTVTPDAYDVASDGTIRCVIGRKDRRADLSHAGGGVTVSEVLRTARALADDTATELAGLGNRIAALLGHPQDVEWAIANGDVWILQARPITAALPAIPAPGSRAPGAALTGTPGSHGIVTAEARIVRGPSEFSRVRPGQIIVCPYTDPAWTPLFSLAAGVITETGGALSHAAIIAREYGIPAVLGVAQATTRLHDGDHLTVDGSAGTVAPA